MGKILKDIYSDEVLSSSLGFKGGTCAYFFYFLPRFSVDLDFDLVTQDVASDKILHALEDILRVYGVVKEARVKKFTIFLLLSYGDADHNIKIEVNTRKLLEDFGSVYEIREYLGIAILAAKNEYLLVGKLVALLGRRKIVARDLYDVYYFLKNNWEVDEALLGILAKEDAKAYLSKCIKGVQGFNDRYILHGLGELVSEDEKQWVKNNLKKELIFLLNNYLAATR